MPEVSQRRSSPNGSSYTVLSLMMWVWSSAPIEYSSSGCAVSIEPVLAAKLSASVISFEKT